MADKERVGLAFSVCDEMTIDANFYTLNENSCHKRQIYLENRAFVFCRGGSTSTRMVQRMPQQTDLTVP